MYKKTGIYYCIKRDYHNTWSYIFYTKLQIRGTPNVNPPIITVNSTYLGADALYMEKQITTRMEKVLKTLKNLDFMSSESLVGKSAITLSFKLDADIEIALNDVRSKISDIQNNFPDDMKPPTIAKMDSDSWPSLWLRINSDRHTNLELTRITETQIKDILRNYQLLENQIYLEQNTIQ